MSIVIWFTGLSGAGKSTLSDGLKHILENDGFSVCQVDGDVVRAINKKHDKFSRQDIIENNLGIIEHCKAIQKDYDFVIVAVISPYQETRDKARQVLGKSYIEIFLDCPLEVVMEKDVKGLYKKAKNNEIKNFIGFHEDSPYEKPINPDITINTSKTSIESSLKMITNVVLKNQ